MSKRQYNVSLQVSFLLLFIALFVGECHGLSTFLKSKNAATPVRKVAIIGSGISGLSLAHALENSESCAMSYLQQTQAQEVGGSISNTHAYGIETHVFDSRPSLNFQTGAGVQLTGGLACLKKMNPDLHRAVANAGLPLKNIRSRAKPWFNSDSEPFSTLLELNLEQEIRKAGGAAEDGLIVDGEVMATTIMRGALQEVLLDNLPDETSKRVKFGKCLSGIKGVSAESDGGSKSGIICQFSDGTEEGPFDLVVGSDGINSAVKEYIDTGSVSNEKAKQSTAIYSGIRIQYGVQDGQPGDSGNENVEYSELCQYFGDGAYGLGATYGAGEGRAPTKGAFLIFRDEDWIGPFKKKDEDGTASSATTTAENADWTQDAESVGSLMYKRIQESGVPDVQLGPILKNSDRFFELGVYFHNPFSLRGWSREVKNSGDKFVVLAGDAAHAMPPFLGQGSNQAIQDSYCLATKIFQHNANVMKSLNGAGKEANDEVEDLRSFPQLLKEYENTRWYPTTSITLKAAFLGYLETGGEGFLSKFRDAFFNVAGKVGVARKVFLDAATPRL